MLRDFISRFAEMNVLIDVIDPGDGNEMMVSPIGRALLRQLDFVRAVHVIDFAYRLLVGRHNIHVLFDLRGIGHDESFGFGSEKRAGSD
jgi:hypothetical protein